MSNALDNVKKFNNIDNSSASNALSATGRLAAPPIERVRNDEAVFDYLLDGYRNTQIYSGADYGGMVRRVLPFSFTFTPGTSSKSGFGARVVLKTDKEEIDAVTARIATYLNYTNQDRIRGYIQRYREAEEKTKVDNENNENYNLTKAVLYNTEPCSTKDKSKMEECFYNNFRGVIEKFNTSNKKQGYQEIAIPSAARFWKVYEKSLDAIRSAIDGSEIASILYNYEISKDNGLETAITSIPSSSVSHISAASFPSGGDDMALRSRGADLRMPEVVSAVLSDAVPYKPSEAVSISAEKLSSSIAKKIDSRKETLKDIPETKELNNLLESLNQLSMIMTSAGLVYDLYLQSNPLFVSLEKGETDEAKKTITIKRDGSGYKAKLYEVNAADVAPLVKAAAKPRIVENTSREHVVEIADTAKINTLLDAAVRANEVSAQLGLTLGAELAAAVSSSSAFIKRIPYAMPINGQEMVSGQDKSQFNDEKIQTFGWRYYKTPAGVTKLGGIAQAFKTTPLNSSVVVTMPEWISTLTAEYEISPDGGSNWQPVGQETISFSGAAIRGALSDSKVNSFDTWVKYHIYKEVDGTIGLPTIKNCVDKTVATMKNCVDDENADKIPVISGSRGGELAVCGENLYGVKGVIVGGQYIDGDIQKVSNNLIHLKTNRFRTLNADASKTCQDAKSPCPEECKLALVSDFGISDGALGCLSFVSVADEVESKQENEVVGDADISEQFNESTAVLTLKINKLKDVDRIDRYRVIAGGEKVEERPYDHNNDDKNKMTVEISKAIKGCLKRDSSKISIDVHIAHPQESPEKSGWNDNIYAIDMEKYLKPLREAKLECVCKEDSCKITAHDYRPFSPEKIYFKVEEIPSPSFDYSDTTVTMPQNEINDLCKNSKTCNVQLEFKGVNERSNDITMKIKTE